MKVKMSIMKTMHDDHGHGNLIHANYVQEDAEFDGYEFEFGKAFEIEFW